MATDLIQTFFVDSKAVAGSNEVHLTSIELYFREKPSTLKNSSGSSAPGVSLYICDVVNEEPVLATVLSPTVRVDYDRIYPFSDASASTTFAFQTPVVLKTDRSYGIVIILEDQFMLWKNVQNNFLVGTNQKSSGSTTLPNGRYYETTTENNVIKYISDTDLKFKINVAKFISNTATQNLVNGDYEFLTLSNTSGTFTGGETVWQVESLANGTISVSVGNTTITGNGTSFTGYAENSFIVIKSGNTEQAIRIDSVIDDTNIVANISPSFTNTVATYYPAVVGDVMLYQPLKNKLYLANSSANATMSFGTTKYIRGGVSNATSNVASIDKLEVDLILPKVKIDSFAQVDSTVEYVLANNTLYSSNSSLKSLKKDELNDTYGFIASKSLELTSNNMMNNKSLNIEVDFNIHQNSNALFTYPKIDLANADVFVMTYNISSNTYSGSSDTEVNPHSGSSSARYISNKISFANNRFAEDSVIYINAYRPANTDIQVYVKLHNSVDTDAFDDKYWTPMTMTENVDKYSGSKNDLVEYSYLLPLYAPTSNTVSGKFTSQSNTVLLATTDPTSSVSVNTAIKIYDPLFPENYDVRLVSAVNSTSITVDSAMPSSTSGLNVDNLLYSRTAFRNKSNDYISRYYSDNGSIFDTYDSMQVKVVLVSTDSTKVPEVDYLQFIGVSA